MKKVFLFAGQGQQFAGMGQDLSARYPEAEKVYSQAKKILGYDVLSLTEEQLAQTEYTQVAILTLSQSLFRILTEKNIRPQITAGLSLGEYNALIASGVLDFSDTLPLIAKRGKIMSEALEPGTTGMAAVLRSDIQTVEQVLSLPVFENRVAICNINTHEQIVIGGFLDTLTAATGELKARGVRKVIPLDVSVVSHMHLLRPAGKKLRSELESLTYQKPVIPFINNVEADFQENGFVDTLSRQISESTRMYNIILKMLDGGAETFIEVGPKGSLSGLVRAVAKKEERNVRIFNVYDEATVTTLMESL